MKPIRLLLDLDGVLVKDKALNPFPETAEFLEFLRSREVPFRVVSNNSTRPPKEIVERLKEKGIDLREEEFVSPLKVLPSYLRERGLYCIYLIGTPSLKSCLQEEGFELSEDHRADAVVIGQDRELSFEKLKKAVSCVFLSKAKIVPVNQSRIVKDDDGLYFPGAGSIAQMIAHACNYQEEIPNLGKPSKEFIEYAVKELPKGDTYLVSDDLYTDLIGAKALGIKTVFMTTGKYPKEEIFRANFTPDYTFDGLKELQKFLEITIF